MKTIFWVNMLYIRKPAVVGTHERCHCSEINIVRLKFLIDLVKGRKNRESPIESPFIKRTLKTVTAGGRTEQEDFEESCRKKYTGSGHHVFPGEQRCLPSALFDFVYRAVEPGRKS